MPTIISGSGGGKVLVYENGINNPAYPITKTSPYGNLNLNSNGVLENYHCIFSISNIPKNTTVIFEGVFQKRGGTPTSSVQNNIYCENTTDVDHLSKCIITGVEVNNWTDSKYSKVHGFNYIKRTDYSKPVFYSNPIEKSIFITRIYFV